MLITEKVATKSLILDPNNARKHNSRNIEDIKNSLKRFGQQKPIVIDTDNIVRAGNGTLIAAMQLGWDEIDIIRTKLNSKEVVAYSLVDNRTQETSDWDYEILIKTLNELETDSIVINDLGWADKELQQLLEAENLSSSNDSTDAKQETRTSDKQKPTKGSKRQKSDEKPLVLFLDNEQRKLVDSAIAYIKQFNESEGNEINEAKAIELICIEFINNLPES